nr:hypothetical protein [Phytoactinopolyspora alkaliphila]
MLTQAEEVACFKDVARHLCPGGRFVIEPGVFSPAQVLPPPWMSANVVTGQP